MMQHNNIMQHNNTDNTHRSLCALAIVFTIVTIRPVLNFSKIVLPSRKSLEIIINIKKQKKQKKNFKKRKKKKKREKKGGEKRGCPLIRVCSLIRSNTVCLLQLQ